MRPELRLIRYFVAVAQTGNVARAAERLHISQPSLSSALRQLELQVGVDLLHRRGRRIALTDAGELLASRGVELLDHADAVVAEVRGPAAAVGRVRLGASPTARHGTLPTLLAACARTAPGVMIYTSEDTTGALIRDVAGTTLDLALTFCAPTKLPPGLVLHPVLTEPAVVHLREDHPLGQRPSLKLTDLAEETVLVAASRDSAGFTDRILNAFQNAGLTARTRTDPYPDLGLQAVRDGLGVVIYARGAFPPQLPGSAFVELTPPLELPFDLVARRSAARTATQAVIAAAISLGGDPKPSDSRGANAPEGKAAGLESHPRSPGSSPAQPA